MTTTDFIQDIEHKTGLKLKQIQLVGLEVTPAQVDIVNNIYAVSRSVLFYILNPSRGIIGLVFPHQLFYWYNAVSELDYQLLECFKTIRPDTCPICTDKIQDYPKVCRKCFYKFDFKCLETMFFRESINHLHCPMCQTDGLAMTMIHQLILHYPTRQSEFVTHLFSQDSQFTRSALEQTIHSIVLSGFEDLIFHPILKSLMDAFKRDLRK